MVNRFSRRKAEDETKLSWGWDVSAEGMWCMWKLSGTRGGVRAVIVGDLDLVVPIPLGLMPSIQLTAALAL